jgi:hypothetical protein
MKDDADFSWLLSHVPARNAPILHESRVAKMTELVDALVQEKRLPYTVGVFGTWGCGKTTFLALLAKHLGQAQRCQVIYFNAWKYAGFLEIVPSLIFKILKFGVPPAARNRETIARIMLSLGKEYSDKVGEWVEKRLGIDPVKLFKDVQELGEAVRGGQTVPQKVLDRYYTQVDEAQDLLRQVFADVERPTVVLIDELDRCDPDEAFAVIKQLRVFFGMREVPLLFLMCANPEPIGLAIKHRYGLDSPSSDYEARRILEKFVDTYVEMAEPLRLERYVKALWREQELDPAATSLITSIDERHVKVDLSADTVMNATAFQAMRTDNPVYANLRLLRKSLDYVCARDFSNKHLLWTAWHLEMAEQMDGAMRRDIATVSNELREITQRAYAGLTALGYEWTGKTARQIRLKSDKGGTLFSAFRSFYWDAAKQRVAELEKQPGPETAEAVRILKSWLANFARMDFVILMGLLPVTDFAGELPHQGHQQGDLRFLGAHLPDSLMRQYGWLLANY